MSPVSASAPSSLLAPLLARPSDRPALVDERGEWTWGDLLARAERMANLLRAGRPSLEGARVALLARQDSDWVASLLGILLAGGMAVPLSPAYPAAELAWFGSDADVDTVILSPEHAALAAELVVGRRVLAADAAGAPSAPSTPDAPTAPSDEDPAILFYTSGTTGKPKGAVLTHGNLGTHTRLIREAWQLGPDDRLLHALPLHHLHGLVISLLTQLTGGGSVRMLPRFEAARVVDALGAGDISVFMAVPTMYQKLRDLAGGDPAQLAPRVRPPRLCTSGSAALPVGLAEFWRGVTGAIPLERYGMTEIGVGASNPLDPAGRRPGTVGRPLPTVETRVVADTGELWVRGPSVFPGYWRRPEATSAAFAAGGWFMTGDVASIDDDGYVRLLGRTSQDILKSGGYKLSALEIEEVLREHPDVGDVAVIGLADETWGEKVVAVVEARPGRRVDGDDVRAFAKTRLASYKTPREVIVVPALPRNPMGKVTKADLRKAYG